jgi:DsbC/DsbD-like thiol-disulfide interchange protein
MNRVLPLMALLLASSSLTAAQNSIDASHVKVSLVSENQSLQRGKPAWIGLHFQLEKGWHVYWKNPGDSGEPPRVEWKLPDGFTAGELQFPIPQRLPLQTLMNFGYEDEVLYLTKIAVPAASKLESARIDANLRWMICKDICIPGKGSLSLTLPASATGSKASVAAKMFETFRGRLPQKSAPQVTVSFKDGSFVFKSRGPAKQAEFFPADDLQIENAAPQTFTPIAVGGYELTVKKSEQLTKAPARIRGLLVIDRACAFSLDVPVTGVQSPKK